MDYDGLETRASEAADRETALLERGFVAGWRALWDALVDAGIDPLDQVGSKALAITRVRGFDNLLSRKRY